MNYSYLEDPELYFLLWPRDIRIYCLEPLLKAGRMICPELDPEWILGLKTALQAYSTGWLNRVDDFIVLQNGDLLMLFHQEQVMVRRSNIKRFHIYAGSFAFPVGRLLYDYITDTLILFSSSQKYLVRGISDLASWVDVLAKVEVLSDKLILQRAEANELPLARFPYPEKSRSVRYHDGRLIFLVEFSQCPDFSNFYYYQVPSSPQV